jgi:hypothetical protein
MPLWDLSYDCCINGGNAFGNRIRRATATRRQQQGRLLETRSHSRPRVVPVTCYRERYRRTRKWPSHG